MIISKKIYMFIILLFIPIIVNAEECNDNDIIITDIDKIVISGNVEEIEPTKFKDNNLILNLKMYEIGDTITYNIVLKNSSNEDYIINDNTFKTDNNYIIYELHLKDNNNVIKAKSSKELSLSIIYKNEVEEGILDNRLYKEQNNIKLSFNTNGKKKTIDIITTDTEKKIENPITSTYNIITIIVIILVTTTIIIIGIKYKNKFSKYLLLILPLLLIDTIYAICVCNIDFESKIVIEKKNYLYNKLEKMSKEDDTCLYKYEGQVTDEVGKTVDAKNVYFNKCEDRRNIIFGGFCWQIIRTTETKGIKMIYNGEPVDGKCESTREGHNGIVKKANSLEVLSEEYMYGSSFTYDTVSRMFTLTNTETTTWSDSTYENLINKYTCKSITNTCSELYQINKYKSNTEAHVTKYLVFNTEYDVIGEASYNYSFSPAQVGYMYNKVYEASSKSTPSGTSPEAKFGSSFTYDDNTNTYTLSGTTYNISNWYSNYETINNAHYTCWNIEGKCSTISYVFGINWYSTYYIDMTNGKNVNDLLNEMLYSNDVNRYNSIVKGIVDAWYEKYLLDYTDKLEDTVYCNDRNITKLGAWNPNGGNIIETADYLAFKNSEVTKDLTCTNQLDQFTVSNNKAKLSYPVALIQIEEINNINEPLLIKKNRAYYGISPSHFYHLGVSIGFVSTNGNLIENTINNTGGIRPVISLSNNSIIMSGTGSETDPWIIDE